MPIEHEPNPQRFRGTGTAFIAWEPYDRDYFGYWDSLPDAPASPLEQMPPTRSLEEAIEWGRQRTPRVLIRPESDPGELLLGGHWRAQGLGFKPETARLLGPLRDTRETKVMTLDGM
jgi:hypothetical protein